VSRLLFLAAIAALAQDQPARIDIIDFFGYSGIDIDRVRAALPLHEGDTLALTDEAIDHAQSGIKEAVLRVTGHDPTDIAPVCCDSKGGWMIYIGLAGKSSGQFRYNPAPSGSAQLPPDVLKLYDRAMNANMEAVQKGKAREDDSKGYALSEDPPYRAIELEMRHYALRDEREILGVLASGRDANQRQAAAELLGYAKQSKQQMDALAHAARDPDSGVRNNAVRALAVLAASGPKTAAQIPAPEFIAMLASGSWSDRNKSSWLLERLTKSRDPKLLGELRSQALEPLIEMARWRAPGHAYSSRIMLGRIAGIEEKRLQEIADKGQVQEILDAVGKR
jgi:hypothetical protein